MNATTALPLLSLACPALVAICLYRAHHRKHHATTTAATWLLGPAALIAPVIGAQHTQGWGVVGWLVSLATAIVCVVHLLPLKKRTTKKKPHRKTGQQRTQRFLQIPLQAMVQWGQDYWGGHRPFRQPVQTMAEHRAEVSGRILESENTRQRVESQIPTAEDRAEWERLVNDILYGDEEEDQPEYNEAPRVTVDEHRAQLHRQLENGK